MFDLFDLLFLAIELISLAIQINEYKKSNHTSDVVVINININL